tara:strand:+ start:16023 stop:16286 length:264 start_codon:yes stop_codon:yes gene_type:complete
MIVTERMDLAISLGHEHFSIVMMKELYYGRDYAYSNEELNTYAAQGKLHSYIEIHYVVTSVRQIQVLQNDMEFGSASLGVYTNDILL